MTDDEFGLNFDDEKAPLDEKFEESEAGTGEIEPVAPVIQDRVTVVETVYHAPAGRSPTPIESRFERKLETDEQLYQRYMKVGEKWTPLDCGWLGENVGMLLIHNEEGLNLFTIPTEEELAAINARVVELSYNRTGEGWLVLPRESMRACPSSTKGLFMRCRSGEANITVSLIPK